VTKTKIIIISAIGLLSLLSKLALADMPPPKGWYIEGSAGISNTTDSSFGNGTSLESSGYGLNLNVGYKFLPYFGLEMGYSRYSRNNINFQNTTVAKDDPTSYDITTKIILPIMDSGFEFYAKLGAVRVSSKITISDQTIIDDNGLNIQSGTTSANNVYYGVGAEYYFMKDSAVHVAWMRANGNSQTGAQELTTIGLSVIFG